jgi:hypothetical protein
MRDVLVMRGGECTGDLSAVAENLADGKRALPDASRHRFAFHQLHHHVIRTHVVQRADMGMIQGRDSPGLPFQAFVKQASRNLDGDRPAQPCVSGAVHRAHATLTDLLFNPIGSELFANADWCLRRERTFVLQEALATLPRGTIEERAILLRGVPFLRDALLSQDSRDRCA